MVAAVIVDGTGRGMIFSLALPIPSLRVKEEESLSFAFPSSFCLLFLSPPIPSVPTFSGQSSQIAIPSHPMAACLPR